MSYVINQSKCIKCGACVNMCPVQAISVVNGEVVIDSEKCIECGTCASICPVQAPEAK